MLPPVPTDERLSFAVDQFTGSGQSQCRIRFGVKRDAQPGVR